MLRLFCYSVTNYVMRMLKTRMTKVLTHNLRVYTRAHFNVPSLQSSEKNLCSFNFKTCGLNLLPGLLSVQQVPTLGRRILEVQKLNNCTWLIASIIIPADVEFSFSFNFFCKSSFSISVVVFLMMHEKAAVWCKALKHASQQSMFSPCIQ